MTCEAEVTRNFTRSTTDNRKPDSVTTSKSTMTMQNNKLNFIFIIKTTTKANKQKPNTVISKSVLKNDYSICINETQYQK